MANSAANSAANSDEAAAQALDPSAAVQAYINSRLSHAADLLQYTAPEGWKRFGAIFITCVLPTLLAAGALPAFAQKRIALFGRTLPHQLLVGGYASAIGIVFALIAFAAAIVINRGWAANERKRQLFILGIENTDVDDLPNLRPAALLSAIVIFLLASFLMFYANRIGCTLFNSCLFQGPQNRFEPWFVHGLLQAVQVFSFSLFNMVHGFSAQAQLLTLNPAGGVIAAIVHATLQIFVLAVIFGLARILASIHGAVRELKRTKRTLSRADIKKLAITRLGHRALPRLYKAIVRGDEDDNPSPGTYSKNSLAINSAAVLELIGDRTSIGPLKKIFDISGKGRGPTRNRAMRALYAIAKRLYDGSEKDGWLKKFLDGFALWRLKLWIRARHDFYASPKHPPGAFNDDLNKTYALLWPRATTEQVAGEGEVVPPG